jgi:hypothetical protein
MEQMGGVRGIVYSTVPVAVFIPANILWPLNWALIAALSAAAAILIWRLVARENLTPAISGFMGVGLCALIAHLTGEGRGFYLYGIVSLWVWGLAFLVSLLFRRPLVGVAWSYLKGVDSNWRFDRAARRYYEIATLFWGASFLIRAVLQTYLYATDQATLLGIVKIVLGWPVAALGALITFWAVRKAGHLLPKEDTEEAMPDEVPSKSEQRDV